MLKSPIYYYLNQGTYEMTNKMKNVNTGTNGLHSFKKKMLRDCKDYTSFSLVGFFFLNLIKRLF